MGRYVAQERLNGRFLVRPGFKSPVFWKLYSIERKQDSHEYREKLSEFNELWNGDFGLFLPVGANIRNKKIFGTGNNLAYVERTGGCSLRPAACCVRRGLPALPRTIACKADWAPCLAASPGRSISECDKPRLT